MTIKALLENMYSLGCTDVQVPPHLNTKEDIAAGRLTVTFKPAPPIAKITIKTTEA